ncbi:MAG: hypothetical protein MZU95_04800 [Desulfomicrobium escambiense]|nr:hypothetical protein [Desulfomicrobium escambiense]
MQDKVQTLRRPARALGRRGVGLILDRLEEGADIYLRQEEGLGGGRGPGHGPEAAGRRARSRPRAGTTRTARLAAHVLGGINLTERRSRPASSSATTTS